MKDTYFTNLTAEHKRIIADDMKHQMRDAMVGKSDERVIEDSCGDRYVKVLYENEDWLVWVTVDSGIEVIQCTNKFVDQRSESVELYH